MEKSRASPAVGGRGAVSLAAGAELQQGLGGPWPPQNFKKLVYIMYKY